MKTQHTPGPWEADNWAPGWTVSAPDSHYSICHLEDCNNADNNARLIAAAPELLSALVIAEQEMLRMLGPENMEAAHAIKIARAAIAKATSEPTE